MYPYSNQLFQQLIQPTPEKEEVVNVSGRAGAEAYQLQPNSSKLLLDQTAPIVWLVKTDGAGYKTLLPYDITPHKEEETKDVLKELEDRIARLEDKINVRPEGQSNTSSTKQRKSTE